MKIREIRELFSSGKNYSEIKDHLFCADIASTLNNFQLLTEIIFWGYGLEFFKDAASRGDEKIKLIFEKPGWAATVLEVIFWGVTEASLIDQGYAKEVVFYLKELSGFKGDYNAFIQNLFLSLWDRELRSKEMNYEYFDDGPSKFIPTLHIDGCLALGDFFINSLIDASSNLSIKLVRSPHGDATPAAIIYPFCGNALKGEISPKTIKKYFQYFDLGSKDLSETWNKSLFSKVQRKVSNRGIDSLLSSLIDCDAFCDMRNLSLLDESPPATQKKFPKIDLWQNVSTKDLLLLCTKWQQFISGSNFNPLRIDMNEIKILQSLRRINGLDDLEQSLEPISSQGLVNITSILSKKESLSKEAKQLIADFLCWLEADRLKKVVGVEKNTRKVVKVKI